jgi:hypothetical protein
VKNIHAADDKNSINNNISTKYFLVDNRSVTFTRLSLPFLRPTFFHQKSVGNPKTLGTLVPLSHSEDTLSRQ